MKSKKRLFKKHKTHKKQRKTKKNNMGAGHQHEDLEHYHLYIKFPRGNTNEIPETFLHSLKERNVKSVTVGDIEDYVKERFKYHDIDKAFKLFWRGKKLNNPNVKLRRIIVDGKKIPLYGRGDKNDNIIVKYNESVDELSGEEHDIESDVSTPETE
jgi:hypothetical protein